MLSIQNDFSHFDRLDWATTYEISIRFLVELLAHTYGKKPEQIIEALCLCNETLPTLRYEEEEFEAPSDPQWMLFRYHIISHSKVLLLNTLESSVWGLVKSNSLSCREEIKYKSATYPSATDEEIIFQSESPNSDGVGEILRCAEATSFAGADVAMLVDVLPTIENDIEDLADALRIDVIPSNVYALVAKSVQESLNAPTVG